MSSTINLQLFKMEVVGTICKMMATRLRQNPSPTSILREIRVVGYSCFERVLTAIVNKKCSVRVNQVIQECSSGSPRLSIGCSTLGTPSGLERTRVGCVFSEVNSNPSSSPTSGVPTASSSIYCYISSSC